jgi:hypothetical protein
MNRKQQKTFVKALSKNIAKGICDWVDEGRIPETWDGHELRQLLADRHSESAERALRDKKRRWKYHNTKIVNNL